MPKRFQLIWFLFFSALNGYSQTERYSMRISKKQIEINPYVRYDSYHEFLESSRPLGDRYVTPGGTGSYGININFKKQIIKKYELTLGLGYYRNTFNRIKNRNTGWGLSNSRQVNFLSPLFIPIFTDNYWYNSLVFNIGLQRDIISKNSYVVTIGGIANNYYTFSQYYHFTSNPEDWLKNKKNDFKYSGASFTTEIGLNKRINKISIGPKIIIPIYSFYKTDENLIDESNVRIRDKWFNGFGVGISFNYALNGKK